MIFGHVPEAMSLTCVTMGAGVQLSVAVSVVAFGGGTSLSHCTVKGVGHVISGGSESLTVTVNEQLATPTAFDAVQMTVVVPIGNECGEVIAVDPIWQITVGAGLPVAAR